MRAWLGRVPWLRDLRARLAELRGHSTDPRIEGPLHPLDDLFDPALPGHYAAVGAEAVGLMSELWQRHGSGALAPARALDYGCGYGRVLRGLTRRFPQAEVVAADIDPPAVRFCRAHLGAVGLVVSPDLDPGSLPGPFDLVWAGSVFSHLAPGRWHRTLSALRSSLSPRGVLVLTTHGESCLAHAGLYRAVLPAAAAARERLAADGVVFAPYPGRRDYGITLVTPAYVGGGVLEVRPRGWDAHQDVYVLGPVAS